LHKNFSGVRSNPLAPRQWGEGWGEGEVKSSKGKNSLKIKIPDL